MNISAKKRVLLLHGWGGKKEHHWLSWVERELLAQGYEVSFPKIPNNYNPNLTKWLLHIDAFISSSKPDIVIAHSLGALAWWHYCVEHETAVVQTISVAPPTFASFASKMESFFPLPNLRSFLKNHTIIYALDDPNIIEDELAKIAKQIQANVVKKTKGEHLDHFSGITTLPEVLEALKVVS